MNEKENIDEDELGLANSLVLDTNDQIDFVQNLLPEAKFSLLYRGSRDGWMRKDLHKRCDGKGPNLTIVRSSKGKICGGYTQISQCSNGDNKHKDNSAFLFSVDLKTKYLIVEDQNAVLFNSGQGVCFSNGIGSNNLSVSWQEPMNKVDAGVSRINGPFQIPQDEEGNSVLTGDGGNNNDGDFTCTELEIFKVIQ